MRLLILLSAMIAGLTGLIAGGPARAHEPAAIAVSASVSAEQIVAARALRPRAVAVVPVTGADPIGQAAHFAPQRHKVDERRNE